MHTSATISSVVFNRYLLSFFYPLYHRPALWAEYPKLKEVRSYSCLSADSVGGGRAAHRSCEGSVANSVIARGMTQGNAGSGVPALSTGGRRSQEGLRAGGAAGTGSLKGSRV